MSFSSEVKDEVCRQPIVKKCCAVAECYGAFLYGNTFSSGEIKIITENQAFAERLPRLMKKAFGFEPDLVTGGGGGGKFIVSVTDRRKTAAIMGVYGYSWETSVALHVNLAVMEDECCRASFVRGVFLAGGSVTDPGKRYHLELVTSHRSVSRELYALLLDMDFQPKQTERGGSYITYFKLSDYIEDFLTLIGAPVGSMKLMSAKLEKGLINDVNRRVNCETANIEKLVEAAGEQLRAIDLLEKEKGLENLPDKLFQTAVLRRENPEASLAELAALSDPPVTKSCLNHRLRKILQLAEEL